MLVLTQSEIKKTQRSLIEECIADIFPHLNSGQELFQTFFPRASIVVDTGEQSRKIEANSFFDHKIAKIRVWISDVLKNAVTFYAENESEPVSPPTILIPKNIAIKVINAVLRILSCGRDLTDNDYYLVSEIGNSLGLESSMMLNLIEQLQYEIRKEFFGYLLEYLDEEQCFQCALLLYEAIRADEKIHPAEFKYIENITQLLKNDQAKLEEVQSISQNRASIPALELEEELAVYLFKYLTEIVMCDENFDPKESEFVKEVAEVFGFDKTRQDEIIQPVAAIQMIKTALFPKN